MSQPLTDAIEALTTYANTVTGASDTTLSDAVATLASGYGGGGGVPIPSAYSKCKYLESTGTQYIDTGLYTKANQEYYIAYTQTTTGQTNVFGNNLSDGSGVFFQVSIGTIYYRFGSANYGSLNNPMFAAIDLVKNLMIKIDGLYCYDSVQDSYIKVASLTTTVTENSSIHNILFGRSTGENTRQLSSMKIYHFKCVDNGVVVRDMYPCMRKSDSVLGMYDLANDVFYTNNGTGTFNYELE